MLIRLCPRVRWCAGHDPGPGMGKLVQLNAGVRWRALLSPFERLMALKTGKRQAAGSAREQTRAYFVAQPSRARRGLRLLEATIREAAPGAEPIFSYGIPGFRFGGKPLVWYAAWAEHWSMYPITAAMRVAGGVELASYQASKGTLRFPADELPPRRFIKRLVKARAAEIRESDNPKPTNAKRRRAAKGSTGAGLRRAETKRAT